MITAAGTQGCGVGYSGTKIWTATNPSLGHATGQQEGSNWAVYVGSHSPNAMVFGPYDNTFGQGQHTAQFWLMVDNNSGTDVVATVDVVTNYGSNNLAQRLIRRNEFVAANQWQVFTLEFNNPCFGVVESRVWWSDTVNMKFSQVSITATNTSAVDFEWLVTDHLGTPRMVVNKTGSLAGVKRHDYLPFGEELYAGVSSRTVEHGYTGDGVRQKFTSKERDSETGIDYSLERYYSPTQGRFTSPDHVDGNPASFINTIIFSRALPYSSLLDPQSLNSYSYAYNNPLSFVDPDGHQGEKAPVPVLDSAGKKTKFNMRVEGGEYDSYNIHVYNRKGKQVGRFSLKPGEVGWTDAKKLPSAIQELVESYAVKKWGAEAVANGLPGRAYAESYAARQAEQAKKGPSGRGPKAVGILMIVQFAVEALGQAQDARTLGHYTDFFGQLFITNLDLAARNLPKGTRIEHGGFVFFNTGEIWISADPACLLCRLDADEKGQARIVGGKRCCE